MTCDTQESVMYDTDALVNFENDFVCNFLNKSEPSCLLEMVLSIITVVSVERQMAFSFDCHPAGGGG